MENSWGTFLFLFPLEPAFHFYHGIGRKKKHSKRREALNTSLCVKEYRRGHRYRHHHHLGKVSFQKLKGDMADQS